MYRKSAVPCEWLFSSAGYIVNKMRSSLEPITVNKLVCLHSWLMVIRRHLSKKTLVLFTVLKEF